MGLIEGNGLGSAEIRHFCSIFLIQEDIGGLDASMIYHNRGY